MAMVYQTNYLFHLDHLPVFYWFVFFGTLCSYNFHWYLTPKEIDGPVSLKTGWSQQNRRLHLAIATLSTLAAFVCFILLWRHWVWLMLTGVFTLLYSAPKLPFAFTVKLRKIAYGKTIFLSLAWAHITTMLPLLIADTEWHAEHFLFSINRFFYIYAICILFDLRDRERDKAEGIKSLITYYSRQQIDKLFWGCLAIFFITTFWLYMYFSTGIVLSLLIPGLVLSFFYRWFKTHHSDYVYYFILDGLMVFSLPLMLIF